MAAAADLSPATALAPLVPAEAPPPGLYTAMGSGVLPSWFLRALAPALGAGARVIWIDAGNRFDAYGLGRCAQAAGLDAKQALAGVSLARPFNAFQLQTMVTRKLPAFWRGEPVVLSDPLGPLYDEDLPIPDARKVLRAVLGGMREIPALWLVLAVLRPVPEGRGGMLEALARASRASVLLAPQGPGLGLRPVEGRAPLPAR